MKKLITLLLALLLCLSCLVPAFAEDAAKPETQAAFAEEGTAGSSRETAVGPKDTKTAALKRQYEEWKFNREFFDDRYGYNKDFRQFYAEDPALTVVDHMVFLKVEATRWTEAHYALIDYFDTDEAEAAATTLRIPAKVNDLPVWIVMYDWSDWADGIYGTGYSNDTVTKVILEEGVGAAAYAFKNFTALKTVKIPSTATSIGYSAFEGCKNLKKIVGAENVTEVHSAAFCGCEKLAFFPHMETLKVIEGDAFSGCAFKSLTLAGSGWLSGGDEDNYSAQNAFANNKKLKSVTFLDGSKKKPLYIGFGAFCGCTALKTVTLPKKCKEIVIEDMAFKGCTALKTLRNTDRVTALWRFAFENCAALETFTLPAGVKTVAVDAFKGCKGLRTFHLLSDDIDLFSKRFSSGTRYQNDPSDEVSTNFIETLPKTCTVYVPTKEMKQTVLLHGCKGPVKVNVPVAAPKTFTATKQGSKVAFQWSKIKNADGYRLYVYNARTKAFEKLATLQAPKTSVTLKTAGKTFAVRAFRIINGDVSWSKAVKSAK